LIQSQAKLPNIVDRARRFGAVNENVRGGPPIKVSTGPRGKPQADPEAADPEAADPETLAILNASSNPTGKSSHNYWNERGGATLALFQKGKGYASANPNTVNPIIVLENNPPLNQRYPWLLDTFTKVAYVDDTFAPGVWGTVARILQTFYNLAHPEYLEFLCEVINKLPSDASKKEILKIAKQVAKDLHFGVWEKMLLLRKVAACAKYLKKNPDQLGALCDIFRQRNETFETWRNNLSADQDLQGDGQGVIDQIKKKQHETWRSDAARYSKLSADQADQDLQGK
jgi:hypothetical protein